MPYNKPPIIQFLLVRNRILNCVLLLLGAFCIESSATADKGFSYAGFSLNTNVLQLPSKYSKSTHEFRYGDGQILSLRNNNLSEFKEMIKTSTGRYLIRLSQNEAYNNLYFVEITLKAGAIRELKLSFEKPSEFLKKSYKNTFTEYEVRHPACAVISKALFTKYGKPKESDSFWEEALQNKITTWVKDNEKLSLNCGNYDKRAKVFAMEITLKPSN